MDNNIGSHPIPKNLSNDEYIALLQQQNVIKRQREQSQDRLKKQEVLQREQGFNVYFGGANQDRLKEQQQRQVISGNQNIQSTNSLNSQVRSNSKGTNQQNIPQRRQWRAEESSPSDRHQQSGNPAQQQPFNKYQNPFELSAGADQLQQMPSFQQNKPPQSVPSNNQRKQWGVSEPNPIILQQAQEIKQNYYKEHQAFLLEDSEDDKDNSNSSDQQKQDLNTVKEFDEESYSDSFEDVNNTVQTVRKRDVTNLLMTATAEQLDVLKQSLSNFKETNKKANLNEDEDYIEEIFEDAAAEDENSNNTSIVELSEQDMIKMRQEEEEKEKIKKFRQMSGIGVTAQAKKSARPISATYNLQSHQFQQQQMGGSQSLKQIDKAQVIVAMQQENKIAIAQNNKTNLGNVQILDQQQTPQQLTNLKQINTNPFKQRPVSHLVPKRAVPNNQEVSSSALPSLKDTQQQQIQSQTQSMKPSTFKQTQNVSSQKQKPVSEQQVEGDIDELLRKIYNLDDTQRTQLFQILKELESKGDFSGQMLNQGLQKFLTQPQQQQQIETNRTDLTKQSAVQTNQNTKIDMIRNELIFRVISTHGNPHVCGLTEVELFDQKGAKILLPPACIVVRNHGKGPKVSAEKLINGEKLTSNDKQMWLGFLPLPPQYLEIHIYFEKSIVLEGLKIWNYNKGILDCTKGVQQFQILLNSELKYEGKLEPGRGQTNFDFSKQIILSKNPNYTLPQEIVPQITQSVTNKAETQRNQSDPKSSLQLAGKVVVNNEKISVPQTVRAENLNQDQFKKSDVQGNNKNPIWFQPSDPNPYESQKTIQQKNDDQLRRQRVADVSPRANQVKNAINNAVSSVTKVIQNEYQSNRGQKRQLVDESLDSLDFFKVTNLGRLQNKDAVLTQTKTKNQIQSELSQLSSHKKVPHQGPQVLKSPFPDEFLLPSPSQQNKKILNKQDKAPPQQSIQSNKSDVVSFDKVQIKQPLSQKQETQIPLSPSGNILKFNILTTWGDMNYLGLAGIEVFDNDGIPLNIKKITACPPDINVLPGYGNDPRIVENLIDGHYFTNDDMDVWLTPFTSGEDHTITMDFGKKSTIAMIRIWNYNRSRIHAYRGARQITVELDGRFIFKGEIKKAPGNAKDPEACCEILLFTENEQTLQKIDNNDWLNQHEIAKGMDDTQRIHEYSDSQDERPLTATKKFSSTEIEELQFQLQQQQTKPTSLFDERPQTSAFSQKSQRIGVQMNGSDISGKQKWQDQQVFPPSNSQKTIQQTVSIDKSIRGRKIWINILESWGDLFYVGLNGLEILNNEGEPIPITVNPDPSISSRTSVTANPRDMNSIPGHGSDHRTLEKLFNDRNNTMDDRNMWLIPYNKGEDHTIQIDLGEIRTITGLKFYNYNKSLEDTLRGVRQIVIKIDDQLMTPKKGITLRKAPGFIIPNFDLGQILSMPFQGGWTNEQIIPVQKSLTEKEGLQIFQEYDTIKLPIGFQVRFNFYSTHGDLYYLGLNGIQLFDQNYQPLLTPSSKLCGEPSDIRHLPGMQNDIRTLDKLVNGKNDTNDDNNMWLAPFKNTKSNAAANSKPTDTQNKREPNFVCFFFERPTCISAVQIWNYKKTPSRGVNEFEIEIDGNQVFRGFLKQDSCSSVLFNLDQSKQSDKLCQLINFDPSKRQNVLLINERKVVSQGDVRNLQKQKFVFDEQARPQTKAIKN